MSVTMWEKVSRISNIEFFEINFYIVLNLLHFTLYFQVLLIWNSLHFVVSKHLLIYLHLHIRWAQNRIVTKKLEISHYLTSLDLQVYSTNHIRLIPAPYRNQWTDFLNGFYKLKIFTLTHWVSVLPSYRNQSTDLHRNCIAWIVLKLSCNF